MQFTQIPPQFAPLGGRIEYALSTEAADTLDIHIVTADDELLGAKRFATVTQTSFDAAPYLRRAICFQPTTGSTGFYPAQERTITAVVEAAGRSGAQAAAAGRTFLPTCVAVTGPALLSSMPRQRLISDGECDELTLWCEGAISVMVTAQGDQSLVGQNYNSSSPGLHLFRLNTQDFPGAHTIRVDAGACGEVVYTVISCRSGCRVAWRSASGSIEHYTFPKHLTTCIGVAKQRACGPQGRIAVAIIPDRRTTLESAYETTEMLERISEIIASPQVWRIQNGSYTPTEVMNDETVTHRNGSLSTLEIQIRDTQEPRMPWN